MWQNQRAALENLSIVLKAAGSGLEHIIKANIYLTNIKDDFAPMNEVYAEVSRIVMLGHHSCSS